MLVWAVAVSLLVLGVTAAALRWLQRLRTRRSSGKSIAVVVLGDLGRSPRMLYHAESLAARDWSVSLVGYEGAQLQRVLMTCERCPWGSFAISRYA